ncbi:MAG: hypothetical protein Q9187_004731 [Circinaria calcarea]
MVPLHFGFLMVPYQTLDVVGPLDVLSSSSAGYLKAGESFGFPKGLSEKAPDFIFHHIGLTMEPVQMTGNYHVQPTTTYDKCPPLDYLLVGGPSPTYQLPPEFAEFLQTRVKEVTTLFTTCTGGMVLAATGLLDGKNATTTNWVVPFAREIFPKVKWTTEKQWVIDGNLWTSGGACAGMDMLAFFIMSKYGMDVAEAGFSALDYEPRDVEGKRVPLKKSPGVKAE